MIVDPRTNPDGPQGDHGLVPLINVVFLLLAFFMIAGQIQRADAVRVHPPVSISESVPEQRRLELVVDREGTVYLDGSAIAVGDLATALRRRVDANAAPDPSHPEQPPHGRGARSGLSPMEGSSDPAVLVKADADLEVAKLEAVLAELMRSGVSHAALATTARDV